MSDGSGGNISEVLGSITDSVFKPIGEELKEMGKVASSSVNTADPTSDAEKQQREMEQKAKDAKDAAYQREWLAKLAQEEAKARQAAAEKEQSWQQRNEVEKQEVKAKEFIAEQKEASVNQAVYNAERTKEQRNGVGG
jgi:hypothetical protein